METEASFLGDAGRVDMNEATLCEEAISQLRPPFLRPLSFMNPPNDASCPAGQHNFLPFS